MPRTIILTRMFNSMSRVDACELDKRLRNGCTAPETRQMLRQALRRAGLASSAG